jgi:hypothetical protein
MVIGVVVHQNLLPHHLGVGGEAAGPILMAQHDGGMALVNPIVLFG